MSEIPPELLRAKMNYARELIKNKEYQEARRTLQTIDHPRARAWLKRLDEIEPPKTRHVPRSRSNTDFDLTIETPKKKRSSLRSCLVWLLVIFVGILCLSLVTLPSSPSSRNNSVQSANTSERMLAIQPETVAISDPYNTNIPEEFLENARIAISPFGYVQYYEGSILGNRRFRTDLEVSLADTGNQTNTALKVVEEVLRLFAREFNDQNSGESISARVFWERDGNQCATGVGMGYRVMETINWQNVSQSQIFSAIDLDNYADTGTRDFSYMGWKPDITGLPACRR